MWNLFKANNKIPERRQCRRSLVFMLTLKIFQIFFSVSMADFQQAKAYWGIFITSFFVNFEYVFLF